MSKLHLNLKRRWFDMILSGEKEEEYREIKKYWIDRFFIKEEDDFFEGWYYDEFIILVKENRINNMTCLESHFNIKLNCIDSVIFSNGYSKNRDQIKANGTKIKIGKGKPEWGAEPDKKYFVITFDNIEIIRVK